MSLISLSYPESSDSIAKDYASIVVEQVEAATTQGPERARPSHSSLAVSLQNLYRLLEMFKYHSYADEPRRGVLMLKQTDEFSVSDIVVSNEHWQDRIIAALQASVETVYPGLSRTAAIQQLQRSLSIVAKGEDLQGEQKTELRDFFTRFRDLI